MEMESLLRRNGTKCSIAQAVKLQCKFKAHNSNFSSTHAESFDCRNPITLAQPAGLSVKFLSKCNFQNVKSFHRLVCEKPQKHKVKTVKNV